MSSIKIGSRVVCRGATYEVREFYRNGNVSLRLVGERDPALPRGEWPLPIASVNPRELKRARAGVASEESGSPDGSKAKKKREKNDKAKSERAAARALRKSEMARAKAIGKKLARERVALAKKAIHMRDRREAAMASRLEIDVAAFDRGRARNRFTSIVEADEARAFRKLARLGIDAETARKIQRGLTMANGPTSIADVLRIARRERATGVGA